MAERLTAIFADQIADLALGNGVKKNVSDDTQLMVALKTNGGLDFDVADITVDVTDFIDTAYGLEESANVIRVNLDPAFLEFSVVSGDVGAITLKDDSITEVKFDIYNSPSDGYYLQYDTVNGMQWVDLDVEAITDNDIIVNEIPSGDINSSNVTYTLANTPLTGKVQVFLNGLLQAPGSGKDYTISGTTITFAKAPRTNSEIYVTYFTA